VTVQAVALIALRLLLGHLIRDVARRLFSFVAHG
jgi:hypothetical protein